MLSVAVQFQASLPAAYWTAYSQRSVVGTGSCLWPFHSANAVPAGVANGSVFGPVFLEVVFRPRTPTVGAAPLDPPDNELEDGISSVAVEVVGGTTKACDADLRDVGGCLSLSFIVFPLENDVLVLEGVETLEELWSGAKLLKL